MIRRCLVSFLVALGIACAAGASAMSSPPGVPQNLRLSVVSDGVQLAWDAPASDSADEYSLEANPVGHGWERVALTAATSYTIPFGACEAEGCAYRVLAMNAAGSSEASSLVFDGGNPPDPPRNPRVVAQADGTYLISWDPPLQSTGSGPLLGYHIYITDGGLGRLNTFEGGFNRTAAVDAGTTSFVAGPYPNCAATGCGWALSAYNVSGDSTPASAPTPWPAALNTVVYGAVTPPGAPTGLTDSCKDSGTHHLSWTAPLDTGRTSTVTYDGLLVGDSFRSALSGNPISDTSFDVSQPCPFGGSGAGFVVSAQGSDGVVGDFSNVALGGTVGYPPPATPTLNVTEGQNWTLAFDVQNPGDAAGSLEERTVGTADWEAGGGWCTDPVTGCELRYVSVNGAGESASNVVRAPVHPPSAPANLTITRGDGDNVHLAWGVPADTGAADLWGYRIEAQVDAAHGGAPTPHWQTISYAQFDAPTTLDTSCPNQSFGDQCNYRVFAVGPAGESVNQPSSARGIDVGVTEGQPANTVTVASFTDTDTTSTASEYSASIDWGDGHTSAGTISGGAGSFTVTGSHLYAEHGSYTVETTITDTSGGGSEVTTSSTATVAEAPLRESGGQITVAEGQAFRGTLATFTDDDTSATAGEYSASVDWGDGHSTSGTVGGGAGAFTVAGSHTYAEQGTYTIKVTVQETDNSGTAGSSSTVWTVKERPLQASVSAFTATQGQLVTRTVATFTDLDSTTSPSEYSATIDWGDGSRTGAAISGGAGQFAVAGSHTYSQPGDYALTTTIQETDNDATALTAGPVTVMVKAHLAAPLFTAASPPLTAIAGRVYRYRFAATGVPTPMFKLGLFAPSWLRIDPTTGVLSGTVPASLTGTFSYKVIAFNSAGFTVAGPFRVTLSLPPARCRTRSPLRVTFAVYGPMDRPVVDRCWVADRPAPGGGDWDEGWWTECHIYGIPAALQIVPPDRPQLPGRWFTDDWAGLLTNKTFLGFLTKCQRRTARGNVDQRYLYTAYRPARGSSLVPTAAERRAVTRHVGGHVIFFFEVYDKPDFGCPTIQPRCGENPILNEQLYRPWKKSSGLAGMIDVSSADARLTGAEVKRLCGDSLSRGRLAIYANSDGIRAAKLRRIAAALTGCTHR